MCARGSIAAMRHSVYSTVTLAVLLACDGSSSGATKTTRDPGVASDAGMPSDTYDKDWPNLGCDPLVPEYCHFPFPSNVFTKADPDSPTGRRVAFKQDAMLTASNGAKTAAAPFNRSDGFSPGGPLLAFFEGATMSGLPDPAHIEDSVKASSPVVLLSEGGERVPCWVEIDRSGRNRAQSAFMIRPAIRLKDATRYIIAVRDIKGAEGEPVEPSEAFLALRDGKPYTGTDEASIEARRDLYDDIFARLAKAGVGREDLTLAWDFTTASQENNTGHVLAMRDEVLARYETESPPYEITEVVENAFEEIAFQIKGTITVPLYLDGTSVEGKLLVDDADRPIVNEEKSTATVEFELLIPKSASADKPASLLHYGHGLFGSHEEIESDHLRRLANDHGYAIFGIPQWGMAGDDALPTGGRLGQGRIDLLIPMFDRLQQSQLNHLVAMRAMMNGLAKSSEYADLLDESERYYYGASQGGIFGGTYMAITTDVTRGVLDVMGQPYHLLLLRSKNFDTYEAVMRLAFGDDRDIVMGLALAQMLWDRSEPNGYTSYIQDNPLPGTEAHQVLMRVAVGDHQVPTFGGQIMARSVGAKHVDTGVRDVFGLPKVAQIDDGSSGYLEVDFGLPEEPLCGVPMTVCEDPHGLGRKVDGALSQLDMFLRTGKVVNNCRDNVCKYPEFSGCEANAQTPSCE